MKEQTVDHDVAVNHLITALRVLIDHAEERYPPFESERGQADLNSARVALAHAKPFYGKAATTEKPVFSTEPHICTLKGCKAATWVKHV